MRKRGPGQQGTAGGHWGGVLRQKQKTAGRIKTTAILGYFRFYRKVRGSPIASLFSLFCHSRGANPAWGQVDREVDWEAPEGKAGPGSPRPLSPNEWPGVQAWRQDGASAAAAAFVNAALSPTVSCAPTVFGLGVRSLEGPGWGRGWKQHESWVSSFGPCGLFGGSG